MVGQFSVEIGKGFYAVSLWFVCFGKKLKVSTLSMDVTNKKTLEFLDWTCGLFFKCVLIKTRLLGFYFISFVVKRFIFGT